MPTTTHKILWVAGSRGETLLLGPLYLQLRRNHKDPKIEHTFVLTGEQGMAVYQAIDGMGLRPHVELDLRHPGDDSAIRLHAVLGDVEQVARERRITHIIHAGRGATSAAAALVAHSRPCRALWLRPDDTAGLIPRLDWERGLDRMIESLTYFENIIPAPADLARHALATPEQGWLVQTGPNGASAIEGRRADRPAIVVSVNRRIWGMTQFFGPMTAAAADWARSRPNVDVIIFSGLDMRIEGAVRSMKNRPNNLLLAQPIPLPTHLALLDAAAVVVTDSPMFAAQAFGAAVPTLTVGEIAPESHSPANSNHLPVTPATLAGAETIAFINAALAGKPRGSAPPPSAEAFADIANRLLSFIQD